METQTDTLNHALWEAVSKVFENMAFEEVDPVENNSQYQESSPKKLWAVLPILQPVSGEIFTCMSSKCAQQITENIYGLQCQDSEVAQNAVLDALAEILNTIGGRFMSALLPSNQGFELGFPTTGKGEPPISMLKLVASQIININKHIVQTGVLGEDFPKLQLKVTTE
jgi:CheY-specific phosphatase CheX